MTFKISTIFKDEIAVLEISDPWSGLDPFKMMLIKGFFKIIHFLLTIWCGNFHSENKLILSKKKTKLNKNALHMSDFTKSNAMLSVSELILGELPVLRFLTVFSFDAILEICKIYSQDKSRTGTLTWVGSRSGSSLESRVSNCNYRNRFPRPGFDWFWRDVTRAGNFGQD